MEAGKMGNASILLEKLQQASNEISSIKNSFSKNMDELEKIQSMLSFDDLGKITGMLQDFETRISEAERQKIEAAEGAKKYSQELEKEKERLMKLWDAYKTQEEELSTHEKKTSQFEDRIRNVEQTKNQLEKDLTARISTLTKKLEETEKHALQVNEYRKQMQEFETVREQMEREIHLLKTDLHAKDEVIISMDKEMSTLRQYEAYADYKNKYDDICRDYEKEKDRLTKLFRLYEETEAECNTLKKEANDWQNWFNENEALFNKLFTSAAHLRHNQPTTMESSPAITEEYPDQNVNEPMMEDESGKTKKRLRFRK